MLRGKIQSHFIIITEWEWFLTGDEKTLKFLHGLIDNNYSLFLICYGILRFDNCSKIVDIFSQFDLFSGTEYWIKRYDPYTHTRKGNCLDSVVVWNKVGLNNVFCGKHMLPIDISSGMTIGVITPKSCRNSWDTTFNWSRYIS